MVNFHFQTFTHHQFTPRSTKRLNLTHFSGCCACRRQPEPECIRCPRLGASSSGHIVTRQPLRRQHQNVNNVYWRISFRIVDATAAAAHRISARAFATHWKLYTLVRMHKLSAILTVLPHGERKLRLRFHFGACAPRNFAIHYGGGLNPHTMEHANADEKVK